MRTRRRTRATLLSANDALRPLNQGSTGIGHLMNSPRLSDARIVAMTSSATEPMSWPSGGARKTLVSLVAVLAVAAALADTSAARPNAARMIGQVLLDSGHHKARSTGHLTTIAPLGVHLESIEERTSRAVALPPVLQGVIARTWQGGLPWDGAQAMGRLSDRVGGLPPPLG